MDALDYISQGFSILPVHTIVDGKCTCGRDCATPGKHPSNQNGVNDASNRMVDVQFSIDRYGKSNLAIACGKPLKGGGYLVAIDVDPRNGGDEELGKLEAIHGRLPETPTQLTGGSGQHYLYYTDDPCASNLIAPGLELKGVGSYIIVEPSVHKSGKTYTWQVDTGLEVPIAKLPAWVPVGNVRNRPKATTEDALDTLLGRVAEHMGWLGEHIGKGKRAVMCPWSHEHTDSTWHNRSSGAVILPRKHNDFIGEFRCHHAHCSRRFANEFLGAATKEAKDYAHKFFAPKPLEAVEPEIVTAPVLVGATGRFVGDVFQPDITSANAQVIVSNDPWAGVIGFDEMRTRMVALRAPPYDRPWGDDKYPSDWVDADDRATLVWFQRNCGVKWTKQQVTEGLYASADSNRFNKLLDYLNGLQWDGTRRLDTWLNNYMGAEDTPFTRGVGRKWMISAIARAMEPGCQVDYMLVIEGPQGLGKSKSLGVLAGEWFTDDLGDVTQGKESAERIRGKWIVEDSELKSFGRADHGAAKSFLTRRADNFREAYGRHAADSHRRCVFAATINNPLYLRDPSGARRYWSVRATRSDTDRLTADRDHLWAEAVYAYRRGEEWWPVEAAFIHAAAEEAEKRFVVDPWEEPIAAHVSGPIRSLNDLYTLVGVSASSRDHGTERRIVDILTRLGYKPSGGGRKREWTK